MLAVRKHVTNKKRCHYLERYLSFIWTGYAPNKVFKDQTFRECLGPIEHEYCIDFVNMKYEFLCQAICRSATLREQQNHVRQPVGLARLWAEETLRCSYLDYLDYLDYAPNKVFKVKRLEVSSYTSILSTHFLCQAICSTMY